MDQCAYRIIGGGLIKAQVRNSILTIGGLDVTSFFGAALAEGASACFDGEVSAVKFENGNLVITATGTPSLKSPKVLQENGVVGIEQWVS